MEQLLWGSFRFRPLASSDAADFTEAVHESSATVGRWMSWAHDSYSIADALSWFDHCDQGWQQGASHEFGIFDAASSQFVGGCGLNQFNVVNGFCNLGYWVRESWQRKGAGLAAIHALTNYGFSKLKLGRIEIVVAAGNSPSFALAAKAGAVYEGLACNRLKVHGQFTDASMFSLIRPLGT